MFAMLWFNHSNVPTGRAVQDVPEVFIKLMDIGVDVVLILPKIKIFLRVVYCMTYICFDDLEKAFDDVDWNRMFTSLKSLVVPFNDRRVIYRIYEEQLAVINCGGKVERWR
jgi:hypothetical protein